MASPPSASHKSPKILIVGAGLAGLVLALSLDKAGIKATIYELRLQSDRADGGFLALAPNACRVLDRIGAYEAISRQGFNYEELYWYSARNLSWIGTVWNGNVQRYRYKAVRVARGIVRRTLLDMASEKKIEIVHGWKCKGVTEEKGSELVTVTFVDTNGKEVETTADLVIGADGIHSTIRRYLDPECMPFFAGQMGLGGPLSRAALVRGNESLLPMPAMILGGDNSFAFMPCTYTGDKIGVFATIEATDRSREEWAQLGKEKATLAKMFRDRHSEDSQWPQIVKTAAREVEVDSLSLWPFYKVPVLKKWVSDSARVVVIGDAAHGIPPTGGQGAAMAFEDAATLADAIIRESTKNEEALVGWETHRKERIEKVVAFTSKGGDVRKASVSTFQQILKEWMMWAFFWFKGKDMGLGWLYGYDTVKGQ